MNRLTKIIALIIILLFIALNINYYVFAEAFDEKEPVTEEQQFDEEETSGKTSGETVEPTTTQTVLPETKETRRNSTS